MCIYIYIYIYTYMRTCIICMCTCMRRYIIYVHASAVLCGLYVAVALHLAPDKDEGERRNHASVIKTWTNVVSKYLKHPVFDISC